MAEEIVNRVANSKLKVIDLEDYYPEGKRILFDLKDWLYEGFVLREKDFREHLKSHDWSLYKDAYVAIHCSTDAIIPEWAYMLVAIELHNFAKLATVGTLEELETIIYNDVINNLNFEDYKDVPVIIKGCAEKPVPTNALLFITQKLQPIVKSVMFGEACSSVPLYKKPK